MPEYFREHRNVELSTIDHIEDSLVGHWNNVVVVKSFAEAAKQKTAKVSVIAIEIPDIDPNRREVGSNSLVKDYTLNIDVFGSSDAFCNDIGEFLVEDVLKNGWVYNTYEKISGVTDPQPTAAGRIQVRNWIRNTRLRFGDNPSDFDKYRRFISLTIRKK